MRTMGYMPTEMELIEISQHIKMRSELRGAGGDMYPKSASGSAALFLTARRLLAECPHPRIAVSVVPITRGRLSDIQNCL